MSSKNIVKTKNLYKYYICKALMLDRIYTSPSKNDLKFFQLSILLDVVLLSK